MDMGFHDKSIPIFSGSNTKYMFMLLCKGLWASLIVQLVKNPPAMKETPVQFLGWEELLEKGKATNSSILTWRIPWTE